MRIVILFGLFLFGTMIGSFVCCQAQRRHLKSGGKKDLGKWSVCLSCKKRLKWYDNIPIVSWLILRGKCRNCNQKIGYAEFLAEVLMGFSWLFIGATAGNIIEFSVLEWVDFCIKLLFTGFLGYLAIYDGKWGELPLVELFVLVGIGFIRLLIQLIWFNGDIFSAIFGVGILAGIYFLLSYFSRERLVGGGDWILGLAIALMLGSWWLCLLVMFFANALAAIVMVPLTKMKKGTKIYFGPWLGVAFVIVLCGMETFMNLL